MKKEVSDMMDLDERIRELQALQVRQTEDIKVSFRELADSLSPKNLLRSAVKTVVSTPGLKATAIDTAISTVAGSIGRKLIVRRSGNLLRKAAGNAVKFIVTNLVRNKMPAVKQKLADTGKTVNGKNGVLHH